MIAEISVVILILIAIQIYRRRESTMPMFLEAIARKDATAKASTAVVLYSKSGPYNVHTWPRPRISSKELLIKVYAIGLNPVDWKCVAYGFGIHSTPWISGREAAGTVEEIGSDVHNFRKGDRVFVTSTNYRDNRTSTFQKYVAASPFNVGRLPKWMSFEEGATLGVGSVAAAAALFEGLAIPRTPHIMPGPWILVWGGSCVTGMMTIQFAKQSGYRVLAVADLRNQEYLEGLGADKVVDRYRAEEAIAIARELKVGLAVDCVGRQTATHAVEALQPGGKLAYLVKSPEQAVVDRIGITTTDILIKRYHEDPAYGQDLTDYISHGLFARKIRPVRHEVIPGGLDAVGLGLEKLKSQTISGKKLVVTVQAGIDP